MTVTFTIRGRLPTVNLDWWAPTQRQWAPVLLEAQRPFWRNERSPADNAPWAPLSPGYEQWKRRHFPGEPILRLTGRMQDNARIVPQNVGFAVSTTNYGPYHQFGTRKMPARPWVGLPNTAMFALCGIAIRNIFFRRVRQP